MRASTIPLVVLLCAAVAGAQIPADLARDLDAQLARVASIPATREPAERAKQLEVLGDLEVRAKMPSAARAAYEEAWQLYTSGVTDAIAAGRVATRLASLARTGGRANDAQQWSELAVERLRGSAPQSEAYVDALVELAQAAMSRNEPARAEQAYRDALAVIVKTDPGGRREAQLSEMMGDAAVRRNDLEAADQFYSRSLAALDQSARDSLDYARVANALAVVAASRNQLARAQSLYEMALAIHDASPSHGEAVSQLLTNLGILHLTRGDLDAAEQVFRRALAAGTADHATADERATAHASLGLVLLERLKPDEAAAQFTSALELRQGRDAPVERASLLVNLARAERLRGRLDAAAAAADAALATRRSEMPNSLAVADAATELALVRERAGRHADAVPLYREALSIRETLAPGSVEVAASLQRLAAALSNGGDRLETRNTFGRAIDAWSRAAPASMQRVDATHELGRYLVRIGETDEGLRRLREAVTLFERPETVAMPGSSIDGMQQLFDRTRRYYAEPAVIVAAKGDAAEAFALIDRMRDRLSRARCAACPAALDSPQQAVAKLPQTLIIEFFVHADVVFAFVGAANIPMRAYRIPIAAAMLAQRVREFSKLAQTPGAPESKIYNEGRQLFALLCGPFAPDVAAAGRLLIVPDGPLESLPFAALSHWTPPGSAPEYLVDWKPMLFADSVMGAAAWRASGSPGVVRALWSQSPPAIARITQLVSTAVSDAGATTFLNALRTLRNEPGRRHPAFWSGFVYYGAFEAR